jgi:hypothetical protein
MPPPMLIGWCGFGGRSLEIHGKQLHELNRVRCIVLKNRKRYRMRLEDPDHTPLTEFVELTQQQAVYALQMSNITSVPTKEDLHYPGGCEEDYRIPIVNDAILKSRMYPDS